MIGSSLLFWLTCATLTALVLLVIVAPMLRHRTHARGVTDIDIYRAQLAEVDRDLARGVLNPAEADRTRTEISRRLLAADSAARAGATEAPRGPTRLAACLLSALVLCGAGASYLSLGAPGYGDLSRTERLALGEERRATRPAQLDAEAMTPIPDRIEAFDEETQDLIRTRRAATFEHPQDVAAWTVLAQTEAAIGAYHRATRAQEQVIALKGENATTDDHARLLDLMVSGTGGYVSPEAEAVALRILQTDPDHRPALFYAGLMYAQNDRPDRAFTLWRQVVEMAPATDPYRAFAANQIGNVAAQLGIAYEVPALPGPSADQVAAAEDMTPEDRQAMIEGMVERLAERLASEGGPPQDWARLIGALGVLGQTDRANAIYREAQQVFADTADGLALIEEAAAQAGLDQ